MFYSGRNLYWQIKYAQGNHYKETCSLNAWLFLCNSPKNSLEKQLQETEIPKSLLRVNVKRYYGLTECDPCFVNELHGVTRQKNMNPVNISCMFCRIGACKWNSSFSDNQVMKLSVKIRQFYWWRKNNMSCFKEIKQNLPHVYGLGCSVCLKQIFCNANGAITPVRLHHLSHLVRWLSPLFMKMVMQTQTNTVDVWQQW